LDGQRDILRRDLFGPTVLSGGPCAADGWLWNDLVQEPPNQSDVGARVTIDDGEHAWTRVVGSGGTGLGSGSGPRVHVGVRQAAVVDIVVTWPDGRAGQFSAIPTQQRVTIYRE
jgi:hypothetical protein